MLIALLVRLRIGLSLVVLWGCAHEKISYAQEGISYIVMLLRGLLCFEDIRGSFLESDILSVYIFVQLWNIAGIGVGILSMSYIHPHH